jgi:hypothetical protein
MVRYSYPASHPFNEDFLMRRFYNAAVAAAAMAILPGMLLAQADANRAVAGGGITAPGWMGMVDHGSSDPISGSKLATMGDMLMVTTGPASTYWNPANKASGDYTVKATFTEPKFQNLNSHPHPYGLVIGGNDMGTPNATYLYCAVNGNGTFIVRGFGPNAFQMNGQRGGANEAIHKAAAKGESVTQDVAMSVKGDKVTCSINGKEVASYEKSAVVGAGKLKSTDGVYGIRFAHNTEGSVSGLTMTKP